MDRAGLNQLMDQAVSDNEAFAALATAVQDFLYRFAMAQGLRQHDAAESVQEVLLRVYERRWKWKTGADVTAYMGGVAMNVVREFRWRRFQSLNALDLDALPCRQQCPEDQAQQETEIQRLRQAIAGLAERQREAFTCRYLLRMSIEDTGKAMDCAEGTVKSACASAWENIRGKMGVKYEQPTGQRPGT